MAGYTKSDYDSLYSVRLRIWDEAIKGYRRSKIRLHYHRAVINREFTNPKWDATVALLGLTVNDYVVVVGSGYGWGVERLIELTGCTAVGVDISDYIINSKDDTEEADIDAAIIAAGFDPLTGHGLEAKNYAFTGEPKAKQIILKEDLLSMKSRNSVKKELGNINPTWIITEDMLTDLTDAELLAWKAEVDKWDGVNICHILRENFGLNQKTAEEWAAFTGHSIIVIGSYRLVA